MSKPSNLSPNALRVLEKRYLARDLQGKVIETPIELFRRVARNIAQAEVNYPGGNPERVAERTRYRGYIAL